MWDEVQALLRGSILIKVVNTHNSSKSLSDIIVEHQCSSNIVSKTKFYNLISSMFRIINQIIITIWLVNGKLERVSVLHFSLLLPAVMTGLNL
jgi:hypothetical protein